MTEQYRATRNINEWLARAGLNLDALQKLPTSQQATVGRSWARYQADVGMHQERWGCSDEEILRAQVSSPHSIPKLEQGVQKRDLDKLNRRAY
jgi:hypothetical protein